MAWRRAVARQQTFTKTFAMTTNCKHKHNQRINSTHYHTGQHTAAATLQHTSASSPAIPNALPRHLHPARHLGHLPIAFTAPLSVLGSFLPIASLLLGHCYTPPRRLVNTHTTSPPPPPPPPWPRFAHCHLVVEKQLSFALVK